MCAASLVAKIATYQNNHSGLKLCHAWKLNRTHIKLDSMVHMNHRRSGPSSNVVVCTSSAVAQVVSTS